MDSDNAGKKPISASSLSLTNIATGDQFDIVRETLIGREVECNIPLDSPHISRYHAKIVSNSLGVTTIEDLNSSNGTFVNGKQIKERTRISLGDEVSFDDLSFRLTSKEAGKSEATVVLSKEAVNEPSHTPDEPVPPSPEEPVEQEAKTSSELEEAYEPEEDSDPTTLLSTDQLNKILEINKQLQQFEDSGSGPRFVAMTAPIRGKVFGLDSSITSDTWKFGRSQECEICVSSQSISRHHGTVSKDRGRFYFNAEPGKNLLINGEEKSKVMLKHNDKVQIGPIEFVFRLDEQSTSDPFDSEAQPGKLMSFFLRLIALGAISLIAAAAYFILLHK